VFPTWYASTCCTDCIVHLHVPLARAIRTPFNEGSTSGVEAPFLRCRTLLVSAISVTQFSKAYGVQIRAVQRVGAITAVCMHTHEGISTQRSDGGEESQEGLHTEETIDRWKCELLSRCFREWALYPNIMSQLEGSQRQPSSRCRGRGPCSCDMGYRHRGDPGVAFLASCARDADSRSEEFTTSSRSDRAPLVPP